MRLHASARVDSARCCLARACAGVTRREAHASDVDTSGGTEGVAQALRDALSNDATRIIELFKEWDEDRNGYVSKKEWCRELRSMPATSAADATTATTTAANATTTTTSSTTTSTRRKAIPRLGLDVPKAQLSADRLNQLFDEWDPDKSGRLSLAELVKKLRRCAAASEREWSCRGPAPARQVGSVGPVRSARLTPRPAQW